MECVSSALETPNGSFLIGFFYSHADSPARLSVLHAPPPNLPVLFLMKTTPRNTKSWSFKMFIHGGRTGWPKSSSVLGSGSSAAALRRWVQEKEWEFSQRGADSWEGET